MKVKLTDTYVIVTVNGVEFFFDRGEADGEGFLKFDGWGSNVEKDLNVLTMKGKPEMPKRGNR